MLNATRILKTVANRASLSALAVNQSYFSGPVKLNDAAFKFFPTFLSPQEQRILLYSCLRKLDASTSRRFKKNRSRLQTNGEILEKELRKDIPICTLLQGDHEYDFLEGHFDGVITNYRETHVTSWPTDVLDFLKPIIRRLEGLLPDTKTQMHILHLSTDGEILPHLDNVDASGSCIVGISLGSSRVLRMEHVDDPDAFFEVLLPSGSVYLQRDEARYTYKHSILKDKLFQNGVPTGGQRVSVMLRNKGLQMKILKLPISA